MNRHQELDELQNKISNKFHDCRLLERALTHPSYAYEYLNGIDDNQRLEFLGDAVLGLAVAAYLYHQYPNFAEGKLTKIRAAVVCEPTLADVARSIKLGDYLLLGRGEELSGGRQRSSNLADALEALGGAVFLDSGWESACSFWHRLLKNKIRHCINGRCADYKTQLQELLQRKGNEKINYVILSESGPDHAKQFVAGVYSGNALVGQGEGKTKKEAEQQAAKEALEKIQDLP